MLKTGDSSISEHTIEIYHSILVKLKYNWISYMAMLSEIYSLSYFPLSNLRYADILNPLEESIRKKNYSKISDS